MAEDKLGAVRRDIDRIDSELIPLFVERMKCSERVAEIKAAAGIPVLNAAREQEILDKVRAAAGEEYGEAAAALYREIMSISRERQKAMMQKK